jgi:serine/threonine-protein kinase
MTAKYKRYRLGARVGDDLTLINAIANVRGRHPVYVGWLHSAWAPVVAKVFRSLDDARKEHEAIVACAHPSVVQSFGVYGPDFMLMEMLEGRTLRQTMRRKRLSIADALRTAVPIGAALAKAHAAGYLHMDVKPENIMVVDERPVLFDFGAARKIGARRPSKAQGTDAYLAPEERALKQVGPAADVYSLGVMLYEMLTGRLPFGRKGETPLAGAVRDFRPGVSAELERLVMGCMAADPAARPVLTELLPALNREIRTGDRMWPDQLRVAPRRRAVGAAKTPPARPSAVIIKWTGPERRLEPRLPAAADAARAAPARLAA